MSILRHVSKKLNEQAGQVSNSEIAELCHELSNTKQKLEAEIEAHGATITREAQLSLKLKAAEARIKASQEQEPFRWLCEYYGSMNEFSNKYTWVEDTRTYKPEENETFRVVCPLYAAPIIPPDGAELQRENAELTRKLIENQTHLDAALEQLQCACSYEEPQHVCEYHRKLLAEAKSKAVPDGWQLVPNDPFGYWHVGSCEDECDFFLASASGDVRCPDCIALYALTRRT